VAVNGQRDGDSVGSDLGRAPQFRQDPFAPRSVDHMRLLSCGSWGQSASGTNSPRLQGVSDVFGAGSPGLPDGRAAQVTGCRGGVTKVWPWFVRLQAGDVCRAG